jgi:hypothetical protein
VVQVRQREKGKLCLYNSKIKEESCSSKTGQARQTKVSHSFKLKTQPANLN